MTAAHTASEAGWLTIGQAPALDLSWLVRPGTPVASLVTGVLGIQPFPTQIEVVAWLVYLVPMALLIAVPPRRRPARPAVSGTSDSPASSAAISASQDSSPAPVPDASSGPGRERLA